MSLRDHLAELRTRILWSLLAIAAGTIVGLIVAPKVLDALKKPYCDLPASIRGADECALVFLDITGAFSVQLNLGLVVGLVLASPVWLYQLWAFVAPGLRATERKWGVIFVATSIVLFAAGAYVSFLVLEPALEFLLGALGGSAESLLDLQKYLGFLGTLMLLFGASFEFPLLLVLLNFARVLSYERMVSFWRGTVVAVFAFAAVATPTQDPFSMLALAFPMCALYAGALGVAWVHDRALAKRDAADPLRSLSPDEASPLPPPID